ncbi:MAG: HEAT repeat domain-containing protein [Parahaliea sp.]
MIDDVDLSSSTLRLLASEALKTWSNVAVLKLLSEEDHIVRTLAARELQMRGDKDIFNHVVGFVDSDIIFLREICAFTLGQLGTPDMPFKSSSLPLLEVLVTDRDSEVRAAAAASLGHICFDDMPSSVEKLLYHAASDESSDVRCCVAASLGRASDKKEAQFVLSKLLQDPNPQVQHYAELGLEILNADIDNGPSPVL